MSKRKTNIIIDKLISADGSRHEYSVWTDLTETDLSTIDGICKVINYTEVTKNYYVIQIDPRYDDKEILDSIMKLAETRGQKG